MILITSIIFFFFFCQCYRIWLQETYVIKDSIFADIGVSGNKNSYWVNQASSWSVSTDSTGTTITEVIAGNYTPSTVANSTNWDNRKTFTTGTCVEFDVSNTNRGMFRVYYSNTQTTIVLSDAHYKFEVNDGEIRYWIDDVEQTKITDSAITGDINYSFISSNDSVTSTLKYRDLCIYPI